MCNKHVAESNDFFAKAARPEMQRFGGFHKWGMPQHAWFRMDNPIKMDDLGLTHILPLFQEILIWDNTWRIGVRRP